MEFQVLLFGGTTEGRELAQLLTGHGVSVLLCVATPYGEEQVVQSDRLEVRCGRLDGQEMAALIRRQGVPLVIDATHPYAREATANIRQACGKTGAQRMRVVREGAAPRDAVTVADAKAAAEYLAATGRRALLTVGSKELEAFVAVPGHGERLFARVLPEPAVLEACQRLGFRGKNLIAMQGPFSHALNAAMLRDLEVDVLVTKDSGDAGGLREKLSAAGETGTKVLLIRRPQEADGVYPSQAREQLARRFGFPACGEGAQPGRFPIFIDLQGKSVVIAGGGPVAERRAGVLLSFGAKVRVVAPEITQGLERMAEENSITWEKRGYRAGDLRDAALAVAATGDRDVNRVMARQARLLFVPVSVADAPGESSFWFPAVARSEGLVLGLVSNSGDHDKVKRAAALLRKELE